MEQRIAADYLRANFREDDLLAVVLIRKRTGQVAQRLATAGQIASDRVQSWLRSKNQEKFDVYVSMNVLRAGARGRTKADVGEIRHVYLDLDQNGPETLAALRSREDLPAPNHILTSSPGKYQVVWRVEQFEKDQAEALMRNMVRELGADPAATDVSRVLRLPAFENHKYPQPHLVTVETLSRETYQPSRFPRVSLVTPTLGREPAQERRSAPGHSSQSERDWAYALRALARGEEPQEVARAIAVYRSDKPNPDYYAGHTVEKALAALNRSSGIRAPSVAADLER